MVNILKPVVRADSATYVKVANYPGLYRHSRSGRYYACKKLHGVRRERILKTCDREIAERRPKEWVGNLERLFTARNAVSIGSAIQFDDLGASHMAKTLKDLTAQEILALAIQAEEEDASTPIWRGGSTPTFLRPVSLCGPRTTRKTVMATARVLVNTFR